METGSLSALLDNGNQGDLYKSSVVEYIKNLCTALVICLIPGTAYHDQLKEGDVCFFWLTVPKHNPSLWGSHSSRSLRLLVTHDHVIHSQESEGGDCLCSAKFLLFMQSGTADYTVVLPTSQMSLPRSINIIQIIPQRHAHRLTFQVILNPIKLITSVNHHKCL